MSKKPNPGNQWVVPQGKRWVVKSEGISQPTSIHNKQSNAIKQARSNAINYPYSETREVNIQGRDRKIREKNTYGIDKCPPRG